MHPDFYENLSKKREMFGKPNLSGLSRASVAKHFGIAPIFVCIGSGIALGIMAIIHSLKNPEVVLHRPKNFEPWQAYERSQFKLLAAGRDYSEPTPAPKYEEPDPRLD